MQDHFTFPALFEIETPNTYDDLYREINTKDTKQKFADWATTHTGMSAFSTIKPQLSELTLTFDRTREC